MKTTRGTIGYIACLIIGIAILCLQGYKYATDRLELVVGELIICLVAAVLIFAPRVLSEAFGKILDKHLGSANAKSSLPSRGTKVPPPKNGKG